MLAFLTALLNLLTAVIRFIDRREAGWLFSLWRE